MKAEYLLMPFGADKISLQHFTPRMEMREIYVLQRHSFISGILIPSEEWGHSPRHRFRCSDCPSPVLPSLHRYLGTQNFLPQSQWQLLLSWLYPFNFLQGNVLGRLLNPLSGNAVQYWTINGSMHFWEIWCCCQLRQPKAKILVSSTHLRS